MNIEFENGKLISNEDGLYFARKNGTIVLIPLKCYEDEIKTTLEPFTYFTNEELEYYSDFIDRHYIDFIATYNKNRKHKLTKKDKPDYKLLKTVEQEKDRIYIYSFIVGENGLYHIYINKNNIDKEPCFHIISDDKTYDCSISLIEIKYVETNRLLLSTELFKLVDILYEDELIDAPSMHHFQFIIDTWNKNNEQKVVEHVNFKDYQKLYCIDYRTTEEYKIEYNNVIDRYIDYNISILNEDIFDDIKHVHLSDKNGNEICVSIDGNFSFFRHGTVNGKLSITNEIREDIINHFKTENKLKGKTNLEFYLEMWNRHNIGVGKWFH